MWKKNCKMHKFLAGTCQFQDLAQLQKICARSHDGTNVTFRSSVSDVNIFNCYLPSSSESSHKSTKVKNALNYKVCGLDYGNTKRKQFKFLVSSQLPTFYHSNYKKHKKRQKRINSLSNPLPQASSLPWELQRSFS